MTIDDVLVIDDNFGDGSDAAPETDSEDTQALSLADLREEPETEEPETEEPETEEPETEEPETEEPETEEPEALRSFEDVRHGFRQEAVALLVDVENTMRRALGQQPLSDDLLVEVARDGTIINVYDGDSFDAAHIPETSKLVPRSEI